MLVEEDEFKLRSASTGSKREEFTGVVVLSAAKDLLQG
jgi:hypothetical protein